MVYTCYDNVIDKNSYKFQGARQEPSLSSRRVRMSHLLHDRLLVVGRLRTDSVLTLALARDDDDSCWTRTGDVFFFFGTANCLPTSPL